MRGYLVIGAILLLLVMVVSSGCGESETTLTPTTRVVTTTRPPTTTTRPPTTTTRPPTTTTEATVAPTTTAAPTTTSALRPGVVRDGQFEFELLEWFYVEGPDLPDEVCRFFCDEALGQWLVVRARVENVGTRQQDFTPIFQELEFQGRTYDGSEGSRAELNPGLATEVTVAFDVSLDFPETGDGVVVRFHDGVWSGGGAICLRHC